MEKSSLIKSRRAQVWGLDLIVALIIFFVGVIILYFYAINYNSQSKNQMNELFFEGDLASELLLSENNFGIISDGRINQSKLDAFADSDYNINKRKMGVKNNFYFSFDGLEINGSPRAYVGIADNSEPKNIIKITRLSIYKNKPIKFELYIWN